MTTAEMLEASPLLSFDVIDEHMLYRRDSGDIKRRK